MFLYKYYKIIWYLYQLENTLNILVAPLGLNSGHLMGWRKSIENISKSHGNFAPTSVDHLLLSDMTFYGSWLIKDNICIPKKVINLYIFHTLTPSLRNLNTYFTSNNCLF